MPFSFGATGGSCVTTTAGVLVKCDTGDGRQATNQQNGLNLCQFCTNNLNYLANKGALSTTDMNSVKASLITKKSTNLRAV